MNETAQSSSKWSVYLAQQSAQESAPTEASSSDSPFNPTGMILLVGIFAFMYFFVIRPQRKEERRKKEMLSKLAKGDKVVTGSGIIGLVHSLKADTVILKLGDSKVEFLRNAIGNLYNVDSQKPVAPSIGDGKTKKS